MTERIALRYRNARGFALDVDLELSTITALVGPNGAGKSTIIRSIAGARDSAEGTLDVGAERWWDSDNGVFLPPEERNVGYVPQGNVLFRHMTVMENLRFGLSEVAGLEPAISRACDEFELRPILSVRPPRLSGGERARVALARSLIRQTDVILLDEALSALDVRHRSRARRRVAEHVREKGISLIFATHDVRDVRDLAESVVVIEDGIVTAAGTVEEVSDTAASPFAREFFLAI